MRHYRVPGLSAAFIENGKIAWVRAYGLADVATGRPVTPDTLFQAASISKPVTAVAAMRLVPDRKASSGRRRQSNASHVEGS
jgi:CubicO group peptidase (beta-lactamase class C family)